VDQLSESEFRRTSMFLLASLIFCKQSTPQPRHVRFFDQTPAYDYRNPPSFQFEIFAAALLYIARAFISTLSNRA